MYPVRRTKNVREYSGKLPSRDENYVMHYASNAVLLLYAFSMSFLLECEFYICFAKNALEYAALK